MAIDVETPEIMLRIQGRIDGLFQSQGQLVLEEIKTVQGHWDHQASPLHWAQAQCYGHMYARDPEMEEITVLLTYVELESNEVTQFRQSFSRSALAQFFEETSAIYLEWVQRRHRWCVARDESIRSLRFPFAQYRPGQRELAVAAYRALTHQKRLFLEAPTGIGKTVSVVFPALKALGEGKLGRIFYLTARTMGRTVAEKAFADLRAGGLQAQTLTLTAKEKVCLQEGQACDPQDCPFARGYFDRIKPAMLEALRHEAITRSVLEATGRAHQVCPFELSLDVSLWVDAVICDYNYVFDPQVYLRRHFAGDTSDCCFLVDEAHNLADRAREMFSAELEVRPIQEVRRAIKSKLPRCVRALGRLCSALRQPGVARQRDSEDLAELDLFSAGKATEMGAETAPHLEERPGHEGVVREDGKLIRKELPEALPPLIETVLKEAEAWLARNEAAEFREALLELYFRLRAFQRTSEQYDERYVTIFESEPATRVRLFCLDPSLLLQQALDRGKSAILFSATLTPTDYYRSLLGGRADDPMLQLPSPFPAENLAVILHDRIRTHFKARSETMEDVARTIGALVEEHAGNYLVYLPSYQYLSSVHELFSQLHPRVPVLAQRPGMTESERETFLAAYTNSTDPTLEMKNPSAAGKTLVGFAVMGGIFGEGIDLVGDNLIGAIIVGVGLPQICVERDLIRDYFQEKTGGGFDHAYTFPGMNRVLQAAGRVIRSETDRGVVLLIDTRFAETRYRRLLPRWWHPVRVRTVDHLRRILSPFWHHAS